MENTTGNIKFSIGEFGHISTDPIVDFDSNAQIIRRDDKLTIIANGATLETNYDEVVPYKGLFIIRKGQHLGIISDDLKSIVVPSYLNIQIVFSYRNTGCIICEKEKNYFELFKLVDGKISDF